MTERTERPVTDIERIYAYDVREKFHALNAAIDSAHDVGIAISFGISASSGTTPKRTRVCDLWMEKPGSWANNLKATKL